MADTPALLEQLADISEPPLLSGIQLPPIAWFALVLLGMALLYLAWQRYRRWRYFAAKREALALLEQLAAQPAAASQVNQLLKRVLQHYQAAHPALSVPVAQWQHWLAAQHNAALPDLTVLLYSAQPDSNDSRQFYQFARNWLAAYNGKAPQLGQQGASHA